MNSELKGQEAPEEWQGAFNFTYFFGPQTKNNYNVSLQVHNQNKKVKIYNVIGMIKGHLEPGN